MDEEARKKNGVKDSDVRVTHRNMLWFVYRASSEDVMFIEKSKEEVNGICEII